MRHWSETVAKRYLEAKGYVTLAENYTVRGGELDLVMQDAGVTVFIEVKQRKNTDYGSAAAAISAAKLRRMQQTALHYLVETHGRDDLASRFDAVLLSGSKDTFTLEHLENIYL